MNLYSNFRLPSLNLIVFILLSFTYAGCDIQSESHSKNLEKNDLISKEKVAPPYLRLPMDAIISTVDPSLTEDMGSIEIVEQLFHGLTGFNSQTLEAVPKLSTHWEVEEDGTVYRFFFTRGCSVER